MMSITWNLVIYQLPSGFFQLPSGFKVSSVTSEGTDIPQKPLKEGEGDASTYFRRF
jgi:hypothetical protein